MSLSKAQLSIQVERVETAARETGVTPRQLVEGWPTKLQPAQQEVKAAILKKYPDEV